MEVSDWLIVVLLIAIVVVLLDGVRRKLRDRRHRVVVKLDRNVPSVDGDEDVVALAELPNGGARTLPRNDRPVPTLRNLKSTRKPLSDKPLSNEPRRPDEPRRPANPRPPDSAPRREPPADSASRPVPVLMDTVDVEEEQIEHTHVFADASRPADFLADDYEDAGAAFRASLADDDNDDEEEEDAAMPAVQPVARHHQVADTRYHGDDDEDDFDEEDFEDDFDDDDDDEDEEFDEEDEDELPAPGVSRVRDEDDDDFDDEFDDDEEEEDEDEPEDEDEEDDDLDELGFPDDNFGSEEEMDQLVADDYENEPVLLESTYGKATSHFNRPSPQPRREPGFGADVFDENAIDEDFSAARSNVGENKPAPGREDQVDLFREAPSAGSRPESYNVSARPAKPQQIAEPAPGPQEVIIINVMARPGQVLAGYELLPVLQQQGLRLGDMSIFHRHAEQNGNGPVIFSMANMVKPGTFELTAMEDFTTPGVSFFLQIPNKLGNMQAFDLMLGAATAVRNALDGELKDENRSVFTRQTVEHCRQRIRDFELKLLSRKN